MKEVKGFSFSGLPAGIKEQNKKDLGLVLSQFPCDWAGVFTENNLKAPCVLDNQKIQSTLNSKVKALIVNSGNANCCTGTEGLKAVDLIKESLIKELPELTKEQILSASTGVIGQDLPVNKILDSLPNLKESLTLEGFQDFAQAILTTDLKTKIIHKNIKGVNFLGIAKGSGMIHPNLATMLAFILTDAKPSDHNHLSDILKEAAKYSFNQISVDGDTSTNDMVLLLANSASEVTLEKELFKNIILEICTELAKKIVDDGEGSNKSIEVELKNYQDRSKGLKITKGIISSNLVKTAIFGQSPNWGRILSAAGQHGLEDFESLSLSIQGITVFKNNQKLSFDQEKLVKKIKNSNQVKIKLEYPDINNLDPKERSIKSWGSELSDEYVKINADYLS